MNSIMSLKKGMKESIYLGLDMQPTQSQNYGATGTRQRINNNSIGSGDQQQVRKK
jgi:hypothetical protein